MVPIVECASKVRGRDTFQLGYCPNAFAEMFRISYPTRLDHVQDGAIDGRGKVQYKGGQPWQQRQFSGIGWEVCEGMDEGVGDGIIVDVKTSEIWHQLEDLDKVPIRQFRRSAFQ